MGQPSTTRPACPAQFEPPPPPLSVSPSLHPSTFTLAFLYLAVRSILDPMTSIRPDEDEGEGEDDGDEGGRGVGGETNLSRRQESRLWGPWGREGRFHRQSHSSTICPITYR